MSHKTNSFCRSTRVHITTKDPKSETEQGPCLPHKETVDTIRKTRITTMAAQNRTPANKSSPFLRDYKGSLPIFFDAEVQVDRMLGQGSFCSAWTIQHVHLYTDERAYDLPNQKNRQVLCERINAGCKKRQDDRNGKVQPLRCVVTKLRTDLFAQFDKYERGQEDIKADLKILARIGTGEHPNIIELHGIGTSSTKHENNEKENREGITFRPSFLILSRIRYTGTDLLEKWYDKRSFRVYQALAMDQDKTRQLWLERMTLLSQVADAMAFIHSRRIIYRDLKPENVGTDYNGVVKLFDFGLARLLDREGHRLDKLYHLTGNCGTTRYMSPEVGRRKKYGHSADVYSLAIFMYQVLSLRMPYSNLWSSRAFREQVFHKHVRPSLEGGWPERLRDLLQRMWHADPLQRPTAAEVAKTLEEMLQGPEEDLHPTALFSKGRWFPNNSNKEAQQQEDSSTEDDNIDSPSGGLFSKNRWFSANNNKEQPDEDLRPSGGLFSMNRWFPNGANKEQQQEDSSEEDPNQPGLFSKNRWFPGKEQESS